MRSMQDPRLVLCFKNSVNTRSRKNHQPPSTRSLLHEVASAGDQCVRNDSHTRLRKGTPLPIRHASLSPNSPTNMCCDATATSYDPRQSARVKDFVKARRSSSTAFSTPKPTGFILTYLHYRPRPRIKLRVLPCCRFKAATPPSRLLIFVTPRT